MAIGSYIPTTTMIVKVAVALVVIGIIMKVAPIPEQYKAYFRV